MLGEIAILKLFRRLEIGHNLDIEVHAARCGRRRGRGGLFGWVEGWVSGGRQLDADLAMVMRSWPAPPTAGTWH